MLNFDPTYQKYPALRYPIYANKGMVATSSPQASSAGLEIIKKGGNAVDAAIATAAALTVVEPSANGIGSDAFAIVWMKDKLYGLNSSGPSAKNISIENVLENKHDVDGKMPIYGWTPITVPGAPKAWAELSKRFGNLTLEQTLAPAVKYAREGYPCSPNLAKMWQRAYDKFSTVSADNPEVFAEWFETFAPLGRAYRAGEIIKLPNHAKTLEAIGKTNGEAFYTGELADLIDADSRFFGGYLRKEDLSGYNPAWVEPISVNYRGYDVWEIPPNGQGIAALMALNILKEFDFKEKDCVDTYHKQIEAMKMSFADAFNYVTEPSDMKLDYNRLISPQHGANRAKEIGETAQIYTSKEPPRSGTVYLCTADAEGNMVSYIQSNYMGFGSGVVVRGTGISLQNRGHDFSLNKEDVNCLKGGKRTYHTIIPGFITKDNKAVAPFGVMGGYMQPQGHMQVAMNLIDFNLDPQQALDAPRWQWNRDNTVTVENRFPMEIALQLVAKGHKIVPELNNAAYGRGQIIVRLENGTLVGGTESRTDSNIACW